MKYNLYFELDEGPDSWGGNVIDVWKAESVVPRADDQVFMKKGGWKTVISVGFSTIDRKSKKRTVLITVK